MPEKIDTVREILYNEKIEQIATLAAEKAAERVISALTNLDNETAYNLFSPTKTTLTVEEAAHLIGVSKPTMYAIVKRPSFPAIHIGRKILICRDALLRWLKGEDSYGEKTV